VFGLSAILGFVLAYVSPSVKDGGSFGSFDTVISFSSLGTGAYPGAPHNVLNGDSVTPSTGQRSTICSSRSGTT
jgi:hypothetical protein